MRTEEGKLYLFVAIDRTSKLAFAKLETEANRYTASDFLRALVEAVPNPIHTVLTDNGQQFCHAPRNRSGPTARYSMHMFDQVCGENDIEHRLTKPNHPWTTDVIDKSFLRGCAVLSPGARVNAWRRAGPEVRALPRSLYCRSSLAAPVRTFFGPRGFQPVTKRA